jgi:HAD superfamily hydrolase (TIGR01490 family)
LNGLIVDLDGTLVSCDTGIEFGRFLAGKRGGLAFAESRIREFICRWLSDSNSVVFRARQLCGMPRAQFQRAAASYVGSLWTRGLVNVDVLHLIKEHSSRGNQIVLATGSYREIANECAKRCGATLVIATELESDQNDCLTGRLMGEPCLGDVKARKVRAEFMKYTISLKNSVLATDSFRDIPLASLVAHTFWFRPDARIRDQREYRSR